MLKLLITPKWIALTLVVLVLIPTFKSLSDWQWRRLHLRQDYNAQIASATKKSAVDFETLAPNGELSDPKSVWQTVKATGNFVVDEQYLVRKKSLDSEAGLWVATPFKLISGQTITVVRGWTAAGASATESPNLSELTTAQVELVGRLRQIASPIPAEPADLPQGQRIAIDPRYGMAYLELVSSKPKLANPEVLPLPLPTLSEGSHRSYAIQWMIFIVMLIAGYLILLRNDLVQRRELPRV